MQRTSAFLYLHVVSKLLSLPVVHGVLCVLVLLVVGLLYAQQVAHLGSGQLPLLLLGLAALFLLAVDLQ